MTTPSKPPAGPLEAVSGGTQEGLEASAAPPRSLCEVCGRGACDREAGYFTAAAEAEAAEECYRLGYERRGSEIEQLKLDCIEAVAHALASGSATPKEADKK